MRGLLGQLAVGLFLIWAIAGCNEGMEPINRVQPNVIDKGVFEGEWYFLQTVIDTPYSAGYTFVGEQGDLEKVVWEIQEDYLIARRSYEHIAGSEPEGIAGETERGAAVAMFAIEKHFDVRREYNAVTGEELNVIVENDSDHPWNERQFMRIDWSRNLITDNEFLVLARVFDGIEVEPVSYYVQNLEVDHPHRPRFEYRDDETSPYYFDIVNKMFVQPTSVHIDGFGDIPSCYLLYQDHLDCAPGEITVRNSFLKVEDRDYQPMLYTGDRMERFGYFVTERAGYDDHYGVVEPARHRFVNRHDLWAESHERDQEGELVLCTESTAATSCSIDGATCDVDLGRARRMPIVGGEQQGACTIPYRQRDVSPIAYHLSKNFPEDLIPDAQHLTDQWSSAFHDTIGSLRFNECMTAGGSADECEVERTREDAATPFVLCHNPVAEGDHAECGPTGTVAEIGDLRYSLIGWVAEPHLSSPLGYGPSAADPETGELIMGNAFVYGAALETLATFARDIVAVLDGDLSAADIMDGSQVEAWLDHMQAPGSTVTGRSADDHVIAIDGMDAERVNAAMDFSWVHEHGSSAFGGASSPPASIQEFLDRAEESRETLRASGGFGGESALGRASLGNLVGTDIEQLLTNEEMRLAVGVDPFLPVTDGVLDVASPLRGASPASILAVERARQQLQREGCIVGADFADDGLIGLARAIQRSASSGDGTMSWYGQTYQIVGDGGALDYEAVRTMLRHPIFDAVTAHEVGHTVGLRHNFSGSYDALNYNAPYWQLRDDGTMAPRAWDPMTEAEIDGRIHEHAYSTVMDYGNNFVVTDSEGIGHYDRAAIKMGYGDLVEVFTDAAEPGNVAWMHFMQTAGWPVILTLESFTGTGAPSAYTYTDWPQVLGGIASIEARADVPYESLVADDFLQRNGISDALVDASGRPAVPYMFCSDEQADLNPDCQRYDRGADAYESLQAVIDTYWSYYIFNAYRRGRLGFDTGAYASRILGRYFAKLQYANQIYSLYRPIFEDIWGAGPGLDSFFTSARGMGAWTLGVGASYQLLTRVVTTPEPGTYSESTRPEGTRALLEGGSAGSRISPFDGRPIETTWDFDAGYFWFDQLDRAGFYYDKTLALSVLTDPETHFIGRDTSADVRRYQLSFYTSFGPSLTSFLRGIIAEDWDTIGPRIVGGELAYPDALDLEERGLTGVPVDPNASFSIQLYAATYGMALIPDTYDQTFFHRSRIFVEGGPEGVALDATTPRVEYRDSTSGLTYVAASYPDASGRETGVGAQMLLRARALDPAGATGELRSFLDNIDVVRRLSWLLSYGS